MTCHEFDNLAGLLVDDDAIDDVTRQRALKHAATCAACSRRLSDDRVVSSGLEALTAETAGLEAPPRVKAALQGIFAEHYAGLPTANDVPPGENVIAFPAHRRRRRMILTLAAAASIIAMLALAWQFRAFSTGDPEIIAGLELPAPKPPIPPAAVAAGTPMPLAKAEPVKAPARRSARREVVKSEPVTEQADFIPLTWVSDTASVRSGTVVRVEVQRATLMAMGLPVNAARNDSLIKADLIVGDDGIARAIRFVQ